MTDVEFKSLKTGDLVTLQIYSKSYIFIVLDPFNKNEWRVKMLWLEPEPTKTSFIAFGSMVHTSGKIACRKP